MDDPNGEASPEQADMSDPKVEASLERAEELLRFLLSTGEIDLADVSSRINDLLLAYAEMQNKMRYYSCRHLILRCASVFEGVSEGAALPKAIQALPEKSHSIVPRPGTSPLKEAEQASKSVIHEVIESKKESISSARKSRLRQASIAFFAALILFVAGTLLVIIGLLLAFLVNRDIGIVATASSTIIEIISALAFGFYSQVNLRVDLLDAEEHCCNTMEASIKCIEYIEDQTMKDQAIRDIVFQAQSQLNNARMKILEKMLRGKI